MSIQQAAVIGTGVIGAGWVARLVENGIPVQVYDPAADALEKLQAVLHNSRFAYAQLNSGPRTSESSYRMTTDLASAVREADIIIEAVPERMEIKHAVYRQIEASARADALITSSTSGLLPSELQRHLQHPERFLVAHPFNPVYLIPLVELVGGQHTNPDNIDRAAQFYRRIGMHPLVVKKEIEAFIADRLLEAVWREALWLVSDGIATTADIDDAIRYGFGLRWAQMGLFETYRIAGGEAGMRHFMAQFGPCLSWPWTKLMDVPTFDDALVDLVATQSDQQSGDYSIRELERIRDTNLVAILAALKSTNWGAGHTLAAYEQARQKNSTAHLETLDLTQPLCLLERQVPQYWVDYNGHMNESRYLEASSTATDTLLRLIGVDEDYVASGGSYFTLDTHLRHLHEIFVHEHLRVTVQVLAGTGKKLRVLNRLQKADGCLLATVEHLLIHVDLHTRRSCLPAEAVQAKIQRLVTAHATLPTADDILSTN